MMPFSFKFRPSPASPQKKADNSSGSAFPPEFSGDVLRRLYPDLARFNDDELRVHFERFGRNEGRVTSDAAHREQLLALIDRDADILEIGPSWSPAFQGPRVRYLDILDDEKLRARAREHGVDENLCPHIDHVGSLSEVDATFDVLFSSHNIEHQPDLIRHLQDAARVLRPGGVYVMLIPDKRFCFDHFLPETTLAEVLEAFLEKRTRHAFRHVVEHIALTCHNETQEHWAGQHGPSPFDAAAGRALLALEKIAASGDGYIDVHAWKFTPPVFRNVLQTLDAMQMAPLKALRVYETPQGRNEFGAVLVKP